MSGEDFAQTPLVNPKIELNRRGPPRPGWDAWGNEAEEEEAA